MGMTGKELLENYKKKRQGNNVSSEETTETTSTPLTGAQLLGTYNRIKTSIEIDDLLKSEDFEAKSGYVSTVRYPRFGKPEIGDTLYEYINNPTIEDKRLLGGGDADARSFIKDEYRTYSKDNPFAEGESDFEQKGYDFINEKEVSIFNYYYNTEGKDKAQEYLDSLEDTLVQRKAGKEYEALEGNTLKELFYGVVSGADQWRQGTENFGDYLVGGDGFTSSTQYVSGMVRDDLADDGFKILGSSVGQMGYDLINTTTNMLPSILVGAVTAPVGGIATMGVSVIGNAYTEMRRLGYDENQSRTYATLVGAAEAGLQYVLGGISKLGGKVSGKAISNLVSKFDNALAKAAITLGGNMASEGLEEGIQTVLESAFKAIATGEDFEAPEWEEVFYSTLLGALSAGTLDGMSTIQNTASNIASDIQAKELYGDSIQDLLVEAVDIGGEAANVADKYLAKYEKKGTLSGASINAIVNANEQALRTQDKAKIKSAVEAKLTEYGETGDVSAIADILVKRALGEQLTSKEVNILNKSKAGHQVSGELNEQNLRSGALANDWAADIGTERINTDVYNRDLYELAKQKAGIVEEVKQASVSKALDESGGVEEAQITVSDNGKNMYYDAEAKGYVDADIKRVVSTKGGIEVELENGKTVKASDIEYASREEGVVYEMLARMDVTPETANEIISTFKPTDANQASLYYDSIPLAYRMGLMGNKQGLKYVKLSEEQKRIVYNRGRMDAITNAKERDSARATSPKKATAEASKTGKNGIIFEDGVSYDEATANDLQKAGMAGAEAIAKTTNLEVHVFDSKDMSDANGYFKGSNEIYINLSAGMNAEGAMLYAMSHEIGHYIRKWNAQGFKDLADFLIAEYGKHGVDVTGLIERQKDKIRKRYAKNNWTLPSEARLFDMAYEELVADAMSDMLADPNAYKKLEKFKKKNFKAWKKLGEVIKQVLDKLKNALGIYRNSSPVAEEALHVRDFSLEAYNKLQDLYIKAFVEADNNYSSAENTLAESGIAVNPDTDSASLLSVRDVLSEDQRKKVASALATRFGVTKEEAMDWLKAETSMASLILNPKYSQYLDYTPDPNEVAIKQNSDYPQGTVDFSPICAKRREFTSVMNNILRLFPNHVFAATDLAKIRTIMQEEGMTIPCGICYVEDRRQLDTIVAQNFIDSLKLYREGSKTRPDGKPFNANQLKGLSLIDGDSYTPSVYELVSLEGLNVLKEKNPNMAEAWVKFNNARGMQSVRLLANEAEYKRQILKYTKKTVQAKNDKGGLRVYSFSDAEMFHLIDIIQVITDSATVGLYLQGYTKVNEYARAVKDTGEKLNRSLIPKGELGYHIEDGKVVLDYDTVEGIDINHPDFFDNRDNPNVGNITIGVSDVQIRAAMVSDFVDQIIPFHTGQSEEVLGEKGIATWSNYKDFQTEKDIATGKVSEHQINIYTEVLQVLEKEGKPINKRTFVEKFLQVCKDNGLTPRFSQFLNTNENGEYVYTEGYHKMLVDFKTFAQTEVGEYLPQMPVKPIFDNEYITKVLKDYVESQKVKDADITKSMPKVIERITNEIVKPSETKYSDRDNIGYHAGDLGKAEFLHQQGYSRGTGHFGTGTYFVGDEARINGSTYGKRPHHAVDFSTYNLYKVKNDKDGYELHEQLRVIDGGISQEWITAAENDQYRLVGMTDVYDLAEKRFGKDQYSNEAMESAILELAEKHGIELLSREEYSKEYGISLDDEDFTFYYLDDYLKYTFRVESERINSDYKEFRDAHLSLKLRFGFGDKVLKALEAVLEYQNANADTRFYSDKKDSLATVFMKRLGYEGIDVRGTGLDNVEYGSVIYDLKEDTVLYSGREIEPVTESEYETLKKHFGVTANFRVAGYLLPDGKLLDFSGKHWGDTTSRTRQVDHRDAEEVLERGNNGINSMVDMIGSGSIRLMPETGGINLAVYPNEKQRRVLSVYIKQMLATEGQVIIDYDAVGGDTVHSRVYEKYASSAQILSDIRNYFNGARQSDLMSFHTMYSDRDTDSVSNRSLLANALESVAQNDIEKTKLTQYKEKIALIESEQKKLAETRAKIKELSFAKGARDTEAIKKLQFDANQMANRINTYDKQLLSLESTKALKGVLEREKANLRKRIEQKGKEAIKAQKEKNAETVRELMNRHTESRKAAVEGRHKTEMRHKIKKVVSDLNKLLLNPTKEQHVPIGLQGVVADALDAINMDTMNAEERVKYYNDLIAQATTPEEKKRLTEKRDFFAYRDMNFKERITALKNAYAEFKESDDPLIRNAHNDAIAELIKNVADSVGNISLKDMSYGQLEAVYDMYKAVLATVRNANKMFKEGRQETVTENSEAVKVEVKEVGGHQERVLKSTKFLKKFGWDMLKPVTAMKVIGSKTLAKLFDNVRAAEDTWAVDVNEAKEFYKAVSDKYGYDKWDFKAQYSFKDGSGEEFSISLEQMLSLYAYSKRDQADEHLEFGGFIFDDAIEVTEKNKLGIPVKYEVNDANPHRLGKIQIMEITGKLTQEQRAFVDEMQTYLSDVMGAKGNEVSLALYDIKLYKEKNYFPLKTARYFREFDPEKSGTPKIKNSGFSKKTVPQAGNPIVLSNFMDVWASHVNDMSMYHAFVLPLEDFMRVYNYSSTAGGYDSVQQYIKNAYGSQANQYIERLMDDLNGGARVDSSADPINRGISLFKKASVFASASVVVQQPSAIARAFAYINPKYFATSTGSALNLKQHKEVWAEVKKYAPVAVIKEMGYFDTGMGRSTVEWIKGNKTFKDKMDDALSKAPAMADELSWSYIWLAVKNEIKATTNLTPGSEEFLNKVGERFTEIVTNTQVYDSVLSRSGMMRSKDTGMKMATAFMAEPTTTVNMMIDGILQGKRGNKKFLASTVGAVSASIILNSILVALVYAARDDDEDETYTEKYIGSLTTELVDGFNPLTYIPFVKDIWSIAQGYDVERSDMSVVSNLWESIEGLFNENKSGWEKVTDATGAVSSLFGIPLKNILRDAKGMYNLTETLLSGTPTTGVGIAESIGDAFTSSIPLWDRLNDSNSNADKLYKAMVSGNKNQIDRIKSRYANEQAFESAMRQALRDNDSRIKEAAQARYEGDIAKYTRIAKEIIREGNFSQDIVVGAINAEMNAIKRGETTEEVATEDKDEVTSIYSGSDINSAFDNGDYALGQQIISELIETKVANGMIENNAKSSIRSSMTSYWKPLYKEAYQSGDTNEMARIRQILYSSGLYGSANDVVKTTQNWLRD